MLIIEIYNTLNSVYLLEHFMVDKDDDQTEKPLEQETIEKDDIESIPSEQKTITQPHNENELLEKNESINSLEDELRQLDAEMSVDKPYDYQKASATVSVIVGKWAMPTTVLLVLITCISGFYLEEAKFTPVVGMIAPVVMALIMVIREASVGKDQDTTLLNSESERKERREQQNNEKEIRMAQMEVDERIKAQEMQEQVRQFNMFHNSTREVLELVRETNDKIARQFEKPNSTELQVGDTRIKIGSQGAEISTPDNQSD